ncbi:oxidoreductase, short chain dehydrogenase/reductase family protein, partial [Ostertagia ostertagi]
MFAKEGAMVTICGRDEKTLNETKSMVLAVNGGDEKKVFLARGDICKEEVMNDIVDGTVNAFGRLDVLVNNAGGTNSGDWQKPELECDLSNFEYTLDLNTKSVLRLCQLAFPHLIKSKGEIVNVSSIAGLSNGASIPSPYYSIAKAAQDQLTRNLAIYYIQKGVRVNGVNPGMISTNFVQRQGIPAELMRKVEQEIAASPSRVPCGRPGTPDEVAEAILFLADSFLPENCPYLVGDGIRSSYIVGHQLVIDGGSSLQMPLVADGLKIFADVLGGKTAKEMGPFDSRAVIVTGSSNGIGRAAAVLFAKEGAKVTICGRDENTLKETKSMVLAVNGGIEKNIFLVRGDICNEEVMKEIVDGTVNAFGRLDVLVNNAGGTSATDFGKPELESDLSSFEYTLNLNTKSVLRLCQMAFPHLVESSGEIVNVGSVAGLPNGASIASPYYSIAKAAQDQLTRNLAIYYIQKGVRVNAVSPGIISTSIAQKQGISADLARKAEKEIAASPSRVPCGRPGTSDEVAEAILFLADRQRSSYIVGHLLVIDGGSSLQMGLVADGFQIFADVLGGPSPPKA